MYLLLRTLTPTRTRKLRVRLELEPLESRVTPSAVIAVNADANVHAIDPNIYGSAFATTAQLADLNLSINRDGGNASDTYNWQADASNHASDWYYESIPSDPGSSMDDFVSQTEAGGAQPDLTIPILPYVAIVGPGGADLGSYPVSVYGQQQSTDPYDSNFGNGVTPGGQNIVDTNPLYNYVANSPAFEQSWIQHLLTTFGTPGNGGVQYFTLGNEPGLWNSTHMDIHPNGETNTELLQDYIDYAGMIKSIDPNAQIIGPEEWGWTNYFVDGADAAAGNYGATYTGINGEQLNVEQWLLQQLDQYQIQTGTRLLDIFSLHYYPQEGVNGDNNGGVDSNNVDQATELLRNQVTRSLWDPSYVDPSWIASTGINGGKIDLIPLMQNWVNTYYPGTQTGITEYNFGAEGDMNGATTQADVYGIFGQQGLDLATRWTTPATGSPTYLAMKLWRNYDGNDSGFGNTSVAASVASPDQTDAFAALRSSDGALTVAVVNKNLYDASNPSATTSVTVNLSGFTSNGVAQDWQLAAVNPGDQTNAAITHLSDVDFSGNSFTVNVPMESVTMFVIEPGSTAPPKVTGDPSSEFLRAGQTASFAAAATGTPVPTVQWQVSTNGGTTWSNVTGATATTYAFTAAASQNGDKYRAAFTNSSGSVDSGDATLNVETITDPADQTIIAGQSATFISTAKGPTVAVQWQVSTDGGTTWSNVADATATTLTFTSAPAQNGNEYRAAYTNADGTIDSNAATLTVETINDPTSAIVIAGQTAAFTVSVNNGAAPAVQWEISTDDGQTFKAISGATATILSFAAMSAQNGDEFRAEFTTSGGTDDSGDATLMVETINDPTSATVVAGQAATFTVSVNNGAMPPVQWQVSNDDGASWSNVAGATAATLSFTAAASQNGNEYQAAFTTTAGTVDSAAATLTVVHAPRITMQPTRRTVTAGQPVSLRVAATGTAPLIYQWQQQVSGNWTDVGTDSPTFHLSSAAAANAGSYQVVVSNAGASVTSRSVLLTVNVAPDVTTDPVSQSATVGQLVSFTAAAGGSPPPSVHWQVKTNGGTTWSNLAGATSTTYTFMAVASQSGNEYRAVFVNRVGRAATGTATLTISATATGGTTIDVGGHATGDYLADRDFNGGSTSSTTHAIDTSAVANAAPQAVYQSWRIGNFTYIVTGLQAGSSYAVRLQFSENSVNATGKRLFDVAINGTTVLTNFDIFATAGARFKAVVQQFTATADGTGAVTIAFSGVTGAALVNGIEVLPLAAVGQAVNAGGAAAGAYAADSGFGGGTANSTSTTIDTSGVTNPVPQAVYQSERTGNFTYTLGDLLAGATYTIRLDFADIDYTSAGQRVFDVNINGNQVLNSFDIIATAGAADKAIAETFTATADSSGNITVDFISVVNLATVSGIAVNLQ